jgi:hypothetical protein
MKLWPIPQDLDDNVSMMLSVEYKERFHYKYDIIKLTFRDKNRGQRHKAIQLISMTGEESLTIESVPKGPVGMNH